MFLTYWKFHGSRPSPSLWHRLGLSLCPGRIEVFVMITTYSRAVHRIHDQITYERHQKPAIPHKLARRSTYHSSETQTPPYELGRMHLTCSWVLVIIAAYVSWFCYLVFCFLMCVLDWIHMVTLCHEKDFDSRVSCSSWLFVLFPPS